MKLHQLSLILLSDFFHFCLETLFQVVDEWLLAEKVLLFVLFSQFLYFFDSGLEFDLSAIEVLLDLLLLRLQKLLSFFQNGSLSFKLGGFFFQLSLLCRVKGFVFLEFLLIKPNFTEVALQTVAHLKHLGLLLLQLHLKAVQCAWKLIILLEKLVFVTLKTRILLAVVFFELKNSLFCVSHLLFQQLPLWE